MRGARAEGSVLVTVLGGLMLVGAITFAAVFSVTLDTLAARSAARGAAEAVALEGALHLAAAELAALPEPATLPVAVGPWPSLGVEARVRLSRVADGGVLLEAALTGGVREGASMIVVLEPEPRPVWRP